MKAVIVGSGIIGLCSAYYLQKSGWEVMVLEKNDGTDNCSYGNAGMIVPSHFTPLASPGIISQGIKWMFNSSSPFYVKPAFSWSLAKWGYQFIRSANQKNVDRGTPYLRDLSLLSRALYKEMSGSPDFDFAMEEKGILMYFKTEKTQEEEAHLATKAKAMGLDAELLSKEQVQALEPGIDLDILGAVHYRCDAHLYPNDLMEQLKKLLISRGATIKMNCAVTSMEMTRGKINKIITRSGAVDADVVIVAGGSWLPELTSMAGLRVPLMPGKGYSITEKNPSVKLNIPAILCEARVAITPMNGYMRYGGTMELAAINKQVNLKRVKGIIDSIPKYFSNMQVEMPRVSDIWYGFRPCSPDGLPFIGFSKKIENLLIAGGHSMMGLGLGPATGKLITEMCNQEQTSVKTDAFNPERFS